MIAHSSICVHILNLRDGSPYPFPANTITWGLPLGVEPLGGNGMAITGSRVMTFGSCLEEGRLGNETVWRVAVWDWKTGALVTLLLFDWS